MKLYKLFFLIISSVLLFSCHDPCENTYCLNGGECVEGNCFCSDGWTGENCQTPISNGPCDGIICNNGGECVNGLCDCPIQYSGFACDDQVTPNYIKITEFVVTDFPAWDTDGGSWDTNGTGADITFTISYTSTGNEIYDADTYFENAISTSNYSWSDLNIYVTSPTSNISFRLYNYDTIFGGEEFMGGVSRSIYNSENNFPAYIDIDAGAGYAFRAYLSYYF